jgi:hypothetical protein
VIRPLDPPPDRQVFYSCDRIKRPPGSSFSSIFRLVAWLMDVLQFHADATGRKVPACGQRGTGNQRMRQRRPPVASGTFYRQRDFHESVDPSIDACWFRALAIDKRVGAQSAHGKARTLPIESRRSIDRRVCADTRPNGHDLPKAQAGVAGPAHRLPSAGMLVKSTGRINRWPRWTYALPAICKRPLCGRVHSHIPGGWSFVIGAAGKRPVCTRVRWHRA